eukprot:scaffold6556_cov80-Cylindrotheca_fusiformis.AAC.1
MNAAAETSNKKWNFETPDFRWHGMNDRRCKPDLKKKPNYKTAGQKFQLTNSYNADDSAYILLNRADLATASLLIMSRFRRRFGLTVHCGDKRSSKPESKTEAMFIPGYGRQPTPSDTEDVMLNEHEFFGFCHNFKYLGTTFDNTLDDSIDVKKILQKANGAFAAMAKVLKSLQSSDSGHTKQQYSTYFYLGAKAGP